MKRKIILNLAMSIDGYISDEDGGFEWIVGENDNSKDTKEQFDFNKFLHTCDTIVMGRKSYEDIPQETFEEFKHTKIYVATNNEFKVNRENVEIINGDIVNKIVKLREEEGKNIWIFGGAILADSFIKADVIDEYIIGLIPCILGKGRRLFLENNPTINLHLENYSFSDGIAILTYTKR